MKPEAILTESPLDVLYRNDTIDMPMIIGNTSEEGIIMLWLTFSKLDIFNTDLTRMIPKSLNLAPMDPECDRIADEMRQIYFGNKLVSKDELNGFVDLQSDYQFGIGLHISAELYARKQPRAAVYLYEFQHDGEFNRFKQRVAKRYKINNLKGAAHADDLCYLFR